MPKIPLSASRIKTLQSCSWEFYAQYLIQVPNSDNTGSILGSLSHNIFEFLGKGKRRKQFDKLIKTQKLNSVPSIYKYCLLFLRSKKLDPFDYTVSGQKEKISHIDLVERMVMAGLNYDFFGESENPDEVHTEIDFDLDVEEEGKSYRIRGFVDKLFLFKDKSLAKIRDFKSSKKTYEGDEVIDNTQDLSYKLFVKRRFPEYEKKQTEFIFLQHGLSKDNDSGIVKTPNACDDELEGFEHFLTDIQEYVENFDEEDAKSNMARDKGFPSKGDGFSGLIKCGLGIHPDQMKKDGSKPLWKCAVKHPFYFYVIEKDGVILDSKMDAKDLRKLNEGEKIEKRFYKGCFSWRDLEYNREINEEAKRLGFKDVFEYKDENDFIDIL